LNKAQMGVVLPKELKKGVSLNSLLNQLG
jgi:hypothetical protein